MYCLISLWLAFTRMRWDSTPNSAFAKQPEIVPCCQQLPAATVVCVSVTTHLNLMTMIPQRAFLAFTLGAKKQNSVVRRKRAPREHPKVQQQVNTKVPN